MMAVLAKPSVVAGLLLLAGCGDLNGKSEPGAPGESCNDSAAGDGCDTNSVCLNGICYKACSAAATSSPQCGGGACIRWERTYSGEQYFACETPAGGPGTPSGGDCSPPCGGSTLCVRVNGTPRCLAACSNNSTCASRCCVQTSTGASVCAPSADACKGSTTTCHDKSGCVSMSSTRPTGLGHCDGEIVGRFDNRCGESVQCHFCVNGSCSLQDPVPVGSSGGESGGVWSCGAPANAQYQYRCAAREDPFSCVDF